MPYKPTGKPPGRPRKQRPEDAPSPPIQATEATPEPAAALSRAREGFRRAAEDTAAGLHRPPRFGQRKKQEVGRRPILHPNVIRG